MAAFKYTGVMILKIKTWVFQGQQRAHLHAGQDIAPGLKVPTARWEDANLLMFTQH